MAIRVNGQDHGDLNWILFFAWSNLVLLPKASEILGLCFTISKNWCNLQPCHNPLESLPTWCLVK